MLVILLFGLFSFGIGAVIGFFIGEQYGKWGSL